MNEPAQKIVCNLVYLVKGKQVCLPLKLRGFGQGWHNGYGGKALPGETLPASAKRELFEESGVRAENLEKRAVLTFNFIQTGKIIESHVFWCGQFKGEPATSEEMEPFWFLFENIPYARMWPDDRIWLPRFLAGEKFSATFDFLDELPTIGGYKIQKSLD